MDSCLTEHHCIRIFVEIRNKITIALSNTEHGK